MRPKARIAKLFFPALSLLVFFMMIDGSGSKGYAAGKMPFPPGPPEFVPDELLVKFKPAGSREEIDRINDNEKTSIISVIPFAGITRLRIHGAGRRVADLVENYRKNPRVEYAEPNYIVHACLMPNEEDFEKLWGLHNTAQTGSAFDADIDGPEAWDIRTDSSSVVIAVIDTGVDYNHPDLSANMWINSGEKPGNGKDDDNNGYVDDVKGWDFVNKDNDPYDDHHHGTHCAGIIAAEGNNGIGVVGVSWRARIMPLKFLNRFGSGNVADAISAMEYATRMGARIMSNSWGGYWISSQALQDAITATDRAGVLFVAAAGNNSLDNDYLPFYPASYGNPNIIAVAATDHTDALASFSNHGYASVDLGAPGDNIWSTMPSNRYGYLSGTSMATPYVAGVAALVMSEFENFTHLETKDRILQSVDRPASLNGRVASGGRLNARSALPENLTPIADAGEDQTVVDGDGDGKESVTLDGSGSSDPDGTIEIHEWKIGENVMKRSAESDYTDDFVVGTHTVTLTVTDNKNATASDTVVVTVTPAPPPPLPAMHVSSIEITLSLKGSKYAATALVTIVDADGKSVEGVTVSGDWSLNGDFFAQTSKSTNKKGIASLSSGNAVAKSGDVFTITITGAVKDGWIYDPHGNVKTSASKPAQ